MLPVTHNNVTSVFFPEDIKGHIRDEGWQNISKQLASLLSFFDRKLTNFVFFPSSHLKGAARSGVLNLKRDAVSAFSKTKKVSLRQLTKSYFEDPSGKLRVVCTFSSRYEAKGKRKYWFGYHEIWNQWLEEVQEGFLLLGCMDKRICFALPLQTIRSQLPNLRHTGMGRDRYWHLDIVDVAGKRNLLDIPGLQQTMPLSEFHFEF